MSLTIAIAPNAFKGTLSAQEAGKAIASGLREADPALKTRIIPMADGGDGTMAAIVQATGGRIIRTKARDPLGRVISSRIGLTGDGHCAVIEMALASGLTRLTPRERNPMTTSTAGTGDLITAALDRGVSDILLAIGGSATVDGGMGMAEALGIRFLSKSGAVLTGSGGNLERIHRIDLSGRDPRLKRVSIRVACDVSNPLCGPRGAAAVFGPQKGATPAMVTRLDAGLRQFARIARRDTGVAILQVPGAGAAGGLGGGLMALLGARLVPGVDLVMNTIGLKEQFRGCDWVITGEGRMDGQTLHGKAPAGVAKTARALGIPVMALCGAVGPGIESLRRLGIRSIHPCVTEPMTEEQLRRGAATRLKRCARDAWREMKALQQKTGT
jgi:glycerate kinase